MVSLAGNRCSQRSTGHSLVETPTEPSSHSALTSGSDAASATGTESQRGARMMRPLVQENPPLRVAVLASKSASRLQYLLENDSDRGEKYEIVAGVVSHEDSEAQDLLAESGVPTYTNDIDSFYEERNAAMDDMNVREAFDEQTAAYLSGHDPDLVALSGYLHILSAPMVERYHPRIINVHHADLTRRDENGEPMYPGLHSVRDALAAGETCTRGTSHIVTENVDMGPLLVRSPAFESNTALVEEARERGAEDILDAYAYAHREWMIRTIGGPTLAKTIELVADGRVAFADGEAYIDDEPDVYQLKAGQFSEEGSISVPMD